MQVKVFDGNIDGAIKVLKRKMQKEGLFREISSREAYEKPSEKRRRRHQEAIRRARKSQGKDRSEI